MAKAQNPQSRNKVQRLFGSLWRGAKSTSRVPIDTVSHSTPVLLYTRVANWLELNKLFTIVLLLLIFGTAFVITEDQRKISIGIVLIGIGLLMCLDMVSVLSNPPQSGIKEFGKRLVGRALPPGPYIRARYAGFNIMIVDVSPLKDLEKKDKNPEWKFENVGCNKTGLEQADIRKPSGRINLDAIYHKAGTIGNEYIISGVINIEVAITVVPDAELPPPWMAKKLINGVTMNDTRLIWYVAIGQREAVLNAIEDRIEEVIGSIGRSCRWQTLTSNPEIASLMLVDALTGKRPQREESTSRFMSRVFRQGIPDIDGLGVRYKELTVKVTPHQKLLDEMIETARRETQKQQELDDADIFTEVAKKLRVAFPNLPDDEVKDLLLVRMGSAENKIVTIRGGHPGMVVTTADTNTKKGGK